MAHLKKVIDESKVLAVNNLIYKFNVIRKEDVEKSVSEDILKRLAVDVPSSDTSVIYKLCEDGSVITVTPTGVRRHKLGNNRMKYEFSVKIKRDMGMMKTCIKFNNRVHHPRVTMHLFVIGAALLCMLAAVVEMAIGDKAYSGQKNIEAAAHKLNETYFFI